MIPRHAGLVDDERGAVAPLAAVMLAALVGLGGLAVDAGVWYVKRRSLQQATDAAAMAAVSHAGQATAVAGDMLTRNGYGSSDLVSVETGYYCADAALAPAARFTTTACPTGSVTPSSPNAVRVTARTGAPQLLSAAIGAAAPSGGIRAQAVAARIDEAGLEIRSGLASADLPLANATLQSLLGGSGLNLSAVQYNGLLGSNVDALALFDKLAANAGATGSYGSALNGAVKLTDLLQAAADVLTAQGALTDTSGAVAGLQAIRAKVTGNPSVNLGALFDLGVWKSERVGASTSPAALKAGLNAYQLASFALQIAAGSHSATIPTAGLGVPGLASLSIQAMAIEPPQSAYFAFGPEGVTVHTAQVRIKMTVDAINPQVVSLPLYLEVASGTATLAEMDCGAEPAGDAWVRVRAQSGLATLYLGAVPANAMSNFGQPTAYASLASVPILNTGALLQLRAKSKAVAGASTPTDLIFRQPPADGSVPGGALSNQGYIARIGTSTGQTASPGRAAEVVSTGIVGGLTGSLVGNLGDISLCVLGICTASLNTSALSLLGTVVQPLLAGLDPVLDGVLKGLGVKLGRAEVAVTGVRCGVPVIVS